jgi:hypothetical protein
MFKEKFDSYVCVGDSIETEIDGIDYNARIVFDEDGQWHIKDSDHYDQEWIDAWKRDEWFFCGVVISARKNGVLLDNHLASSWGIECNLPVGGNGYLNEVADELLQEAIDVAKDSLEDMKRKLAA